MPYGYLPEGLSSVLLAWTSAADIWRNHGIVERRRTRGVDRPTWRAVPGCACPSLRHVPHRLGDPRRPDTNSMTPTTDSAWAIEQTQGVSRGARIGARRGLERHHTRVTRWVRRGGIAVVAGGGVGEQGGRANAGRRLGDANGAPSPARARRRLGHTRCDRSIPRSAIESRTIRPCTYQWISDGFLHVGGDAVAGRSVWVWRVVLFAYFARGDFPGQRARIGVGCCRCLMRRCDRARVKSSDRGIIDGRAAHRQRRPAGTVGVGLRPTRRGAGAAQADLPVLGLSRAPRGAVCSERRWKDSVGGSSRWVVEAEGSLIREVPGSGGKQP